MLELVIITGMTSPLIYKAFQVWSKSMTKKMHKGSKGRDHDSVAVTFLGITLYTAPLSALNH